MNYWEEMTISNFSGPMDLLYNLVKEKQMNIMDLNVLEITNEYMSYLKSQQNLDIEIASEYLTMAATLLELKSKALLPIEDPVELVDEDYSYDNFIEQLSRYEQIRKVSDFLTLKQATYFETFSPKKSKQKFEPVMIKEPEFKLDLNLDKFVATFQRILQKQQELFLNDDFFDDEEINVLETSVLSPQEIMDLVLVKMRTKPMKQWNIEELLDREIFNLKNFISIFLAILDLVKYQIIELNQPNEDELFVQFSTYALENPDAINGLEMETYDE